VLTHAAYCYCLLGAIAQGVPYTATITDLLCVPFWVLIHPPELSGSKQQRHLVANQDKLGEKCQWILLTKYLFHTEGSLTCRKSLTWYRRLYFPSDRTRATACFILIKNHRPRPGLNPRTLGPMAVTISTRAPRANTRYLLSSGKFIVYNTVQYRPSYVCDCE
jgi:hypothetical protein